MCPMLLPPPGIPPREAKGLHPLEPPTPGRGPATRTTRTMADSDPPISTNSEPILSQSTVPHSGRRQGCIAADCRARLKNCF